MYTILMISDLMMECYNLFHKMHCLCVFLDMEYFLKTGCSESRTGPRLVTNLIADKFNGCG